MLYVPSGFLYQPSNTGVTVCPDACNGASTPCAGIDRGAMSIALIVMSRHAPRLRVMGTKSCANGHSRNPVVEYAAVPPPESRHNLCPIANCRGRTNQ